MTRSRTAALALTFVLAAGVSLLAQGPGRVGAVKVVKYDGLKDEILRNHGKVILVDFWGEFCGPCKANFPHIVHMHRTSARHGLVVISVSIDDLHRGNPDDVVKRVRSFLTVNGADFTNFILDEPHDLLREKLRVSSVPCYYVFSRQGKWTQFVGEIDYAAMDRLIVDLLRES